MSVAAVEMAFRSSLLLGLAWLAAWIIQSRRGSAAMRHAVWMLGFATAASLPVLAWLLPPLKLAVLPAEAMTPALPVPATSSAPVEAGPSASDAAAAVYLAVAVLLLARLVVGRARLEQMWRKAAPAEDLRIETVRICALLGTTRPVQVRITAEAIVPMTWGSIAPRILLPREARSWSAGRLHSVLLHELGHVSRHDSLGTLIAHAVGALYWPNPLAWYAIRQMRLAQEQACDDLVLSNGAAAASYARDLVDSACALRPRFAVASVAMASRTDLERRLRSILGETRRGRAGNGFLVAAALVAVGIAPLVAVVVPAHAELSVLQTNIPTRFVPGPAPVIAAPPGPAHPAVTEKQAKGATAAATLTIPHQPNADAKYQAELDRYSDQLATYGAEIERYNEQLTAFRAQSDEFVREVAAYNRRMAEIGPNPPPGTVLPTYPTYPTYPTAPTAPTVPVRPPSH